MDLKSVIDLSNLQNYSNIDVSTIIFKFDFCIEIAKLDYKHLNMFVDTFDDINKCEAFTHKPLTRFTVADIIMYILYCSYVRECVCMNLNDKLRMHFRILQNRTNVSIFECSNVCYRYSVDHQKYTHINKYLTKYSDAIINLYRLTNSDDIDICNLGNNVSAIEMLLLIAKTRVIPKYVMLHKILFFYLAI